MDPKPPSSSSEVKLKNVQCERKKILVEKGANLSRNKRHGTDVEHPAFPNLILHLEEERREVRSKLKIHLEMRF